MVSRWWRQTATSLNPWELECIKPIHRNDPVSVIPIPYRELPAEVLVSMRITAEDMPPLEMTCRFRTNELNLEQRHRVSLPVCKVTAIPLQLHWSNRALHCGITIISGSAKFRCADVSKF